MITGHCTLSSSPEKYIQPSTHLEDQALEQSQDHRDELGTIFFFSHTPTLSEDQTHENKITLRVVCQETLKNNEGGVFYWQHKESVGALQEDEEKMKPPRRTPNKSKKV